MAGFKPRTSGVRSDRSANCAPWKNVGAMIKWLRVRMPHFTDNWTYQLGKYVINSIDQDQQQSDQDGRFI